MCKKIPFHREIGRLRVLCYIYYFRMQSTFDQRSILKELKAQPQREEKERCAVSIFVGIFFEKIKTCDTWDWNKPLWREENRHPHCRLCCCCCCDPSWSDRPWWWCWRQKRWAFVTSSVTMESREDSEHRRFNVACWKGRTNKIGPSRWLCVSIFIVCKKARSGSAGYLEHHCPFLQDNIILITLERHNRTVDE